MNFNKCFELSNGEYFSLPVGTGDSKQADVIVVYETYDSTSENALWQLRMDSARRVGQTTLRILNDNGQITYDSSNRMRPVVNYLAQSWRDNGCGDTRPGVPTLDIGRADSLPLNGRIAEVMYFSHRISDTAVVQWISYLAVKYGITLSRTDYLDSRRNVIWDYTGYPDYCASIAGVGRDDSTGLCQRQTYFADGKIVMGVYADAMNSVPTIIPETNEGNTAVITDGDFIMMGMLTFDNEENTGDSIPLLEDSTNEREESQACLSSPEREGEGGQSPQRVAEGRGSEGTSPWPIFALYTQDGYTYGVIGKSMVQATGDVSSYNTFLRLDARAVSDTVAPVLMIDRSGSGDFPAWATEYVYGSGMDSPGYYMYGNVHWDTDLNGRDAFCFAVRMPGEEAIPKMAMADDAQNNGMAYADGQRGDARPCFSTKQRVASHDPMLSNASLPVSSYRLLPNPNHGKFTVEIAYPEEQDVTVTVYASDGKKVMVMSGKGQSGYRFEGQIETSGHYLIDIVSANERKQLKMVVSN